VAPGEDVRPPVFDTIADKIGPDDRQLAPAGPYGSSLLRKKEGLPRRAEHGHQGRAGLAIGDAVAI
jgi:hypothetical protein